MLQRSRYKSPHKGRNAKDTDTNIKLQARALQPVGQPVGNQQVGNFSGGGGLGENSPALEDLIFALNNHHISILP